MSASTNKFSRRSNFLSPELFYLNPKPFAISNSAVATICRRLKTNFCLVRSRSFKKKCSYNTDSSYAFHRIGNFHSNAIQVDQLGLLGRPALRPTQLNVSRVFPVSATNRYIGIPGSLDQTLSRHFANVQGDPCNCSKLCSFLSAIWKMSERKLNGSESDTFVEPLLFCKVSLFHKYSRHST